jgi:plastocyanin
MNSKIIIAIIIVLLALGAIVWAAQDRNGTNDQTQQPGTTEVNGNDGVTTPDGVDVTEEVAATITYTRDGFSVDNATIPAGSTVRIINQSETQLDLASNPHPTHTDNSELNTGFVAPGESQTFTITQTGTWGFHNHLREAHTGSITVE